MYKIKKRGVPFRERHMTSIKGGPGIIIINVTDVVSVVCPDFKNAVGEMLAMVRQELERVGQKFSALGFVE